MEKIFKLITFVLLSILLVSCDEDKSESGYEGKISIQIGQKLIFDNLECQQNFGFYKESIITPIPFELRIYSSNSEFDKTFKVDYTNFNEMNLSSHVLSEGLEIKFDFDQSFPFTKKNQSTEFPHFRKKTDVITIKSEKKEVDFGIEVTSSVWGTASSAEKGYILGDEDVIVDVELEKEK
jgi:hypothetical protein